ncbi:MAG: hypothetical protein ACEQSB_06690 [Undibacterium sp.]
MNRPKPINKAAAKQQLIEEYEKVMGKKANHPALMVCEISAERAMTQEWAWEKNDNPNWPIQLTWK